MNLMPPAKAMDPFLRHLLVVTCRRDGVETSGQVTAVLIPAGDLEDNTSGIPGDNYAVTIADVTQWPTADGPVFGDQLETQDGLRLYVQHRQVRKPSGWVLMAQCRQRSRL